MWYIMKTVSMMMLSMRADVVYDLSAAAATAAASHRLGAYTYLGIELADLMLMVPQKIGKAEKHGKLQRCAMFAQN